MTLGRADGKEIDVPLAGLKRFDLNAARITGTGRVCLTGLTNLRYRSLTDTRVTGARLQEALSGCRLDYEPRKGKTDQSLKLPSRCFDNPRKMAMKNKMWQTVNLAANCTAVGGGLRAARTSCSGCRWNSPTGLEVCSGAWAPDSLL